VQEAIKTGEERLQELREKEDELKAAIGEAEEVCHLLDQPFSQHRITISFVMVDRLRP
jgi:hypothetical protein